MQPNIEKEYKMMLDKESFNQLIKALPNSIIKEQTNYYYDCNSSKMAARIRELNNKFYFTLKIKEDNLLEFEFEITNNSLEHDDVKALLLRYDIKDITYIGYMETIRYEYHDGYGTYCIDHSKYLGYEDYEIEYELDNYQDDRLNEFMSFLSENNITYQENKISKFKRFIDQKSMAK